MLTLFPAYSVGTTIINNNIAAAPYETAKSVQHKTQTIPHTLQILVIKQLKKLQTSNIITIITILPTRMKQYLEPTVNEHTCTIISTTIRKRHTLQAIKKKVRTQYKIIPRSKATKEQIEIGTHNGYSNYHSIYIHRDRLPTSFIKINNKTIRINYLIECSEPIQRYVPPGIYKYRSNAFRLSKKASPEVRKILNQNNDSLRYIITIYQLSKIEIIHQALDELFNYHTQIVIESK